MDDGNQRLKLLLNQAILSLRAETAWIKMRMAMSGLIDIHRKRGYDPNQLRVPAGGPDGGQWGDGSSRPNTASRQRVRFAGFADRLEELGGGAPYQRNTPKGY